MTSSDVTFDMPTLAMAEIWAIRLASCLVYPMVFTFSGALGSGKTTFIRALLRRLGVNTVIKSPTFSLVESYEGSQGRIHHFDLYRIDVETELDDIGFRDYFEDNALCCIEWPERISLSPDHIDLALLLIRSEHGRTLMMQANAKTAPILHKSVHNFNLESQV